MSIEGMDPISNTADVIDSRDVIARIDYLRDEWTEGSGEDWADFELSEDDWAVHLGEEQAHELVALLELARQGEDYIPDWQYGETLVNEIYFTTYAQELAEDIGVIDRNAAWPLSYIDWEAAADALLTDYQTLDFDGITFYAR